MAINADDNKQLNSTDPAQQKIQDALSSPGPVAVGGASAPSIGASSSGGGVSTAGVGPGGTGGWTNLQSYVNANQGSTSSADYLNKDANTAYDQEKQSLNDESTQAKSQAQSSVDQSKLDQDQAAKLVGQASNQYRYGVPQQSTDYQNTIGQIDAPFGVQYQAPTFSHGMSADAQNYSSNIGTDPGFQAIMSALYNKAAGGQATPGMNALQQQIDTNNPALLQARDEQRSKYAALPTDETQSIQDTNSALQGAQAQVGQNQQSLTDYLNSQKELYRPQAEQIATNGANDASYAPLSSYNSILDALGISGGKLNPAPSSKPVQPQDSVSGLSPFKNLQAVM